MFTFMTHFAENKIWQQQSCFCHQLASYDRTHLTGPVTSTPTALIRDVFSYGFPRKLCAGSNGSYDKYLILNELEVRTVSYGPRFFPLGSETYTTDREKLSEVSRYLLCIYFVSDKFGNDFIHEEQL